MRNWSLYLGIGAIVLSGCAAGTSTTTVIKPEDGAKTSEASAAATALPANQRHEGFVYSGLAAQKPLKYTVVLPGETEPTTVEQTVKFLKVENGIGKYDVIRTGPKASILGNETIWVQPDGVFTMTSTRGRLENPILGLPPDFKVGKEWKRSGVFFDNPSMTKTEIEDDCKVAAAEKVKTAAGEFDTLRLDTTGTIKQATLTRKVTSKSWYAKDIGLVKCEIVAKDADGRDAGTLKMELAP
jgi:hypothetical protein